MKMRIVAGVIVVLAVAVFSVFVNSSHPAATWIWRHLGVDRAADEAPTPAIDGQIVAVSGQQGIVVLSVGSDDGVESGHVFAVFRGDTFIGKVRATKVTKDLSGARILYLDGSVSIQAGDSATTRTD